MKNKVPDLWRPDVITIITMKHWNWRYIQFTQELVFSHLNVFPVYMISIFPLFFQTSPLNNEETNPCKKNLKKKEYYNWIIFWMYVPTAVVFIGIFYFQPPNICIEVL